MMLDSKFNFTLPEQAKINELRQRVLDCAELAIGTEEVLLTKFLNFARWDVARALESIHNYYNFKHEHPDWVARHTVEHFREHFLELGTKYIMPQPDREGRVIVIFKTVDAFSKYNDYLHDLIEMDDLIFESLFLIPKVQKNGITIIYDLSGTTKNFLRMLSPTISRRINAKNEILPFTNRIVHLIQKGFLMNATSSLVMPFMSKEIKEKIITHDGKNFTKLRELVGYDNLPAEYGGPPENVPDANFLYNHLLKNADYLLKIQSYKKLII